MNKKTEEEQNKFYYVGAMDYRTPRRPPLWAKRTGVTWPFVKLTISGDEITVAPRWIFRLFASKWRFRVEEIESVKLRASPFGGKDYTFSLISGRAVRFTVFPREAPSLSKVLEALGLSIENR